MKSIFKYINDERLLNHMCIDYKLYENAGLYDGIEDLARFLTNKIKSHQEVEFYLEYNCDDIQLKKLNNIFFSKIILHCVRNKNYNNVGEYISNDVIDYNKSTDKFNFVKINLELTIKNNSQEVYQSLLHELTHAWDTIIVIKMEQQHLSRQGLT